MLILENPDFLSLPANSMGLFEKAAQDSFSTVGGLVRPYGEVWGGENHPANAALP